MNAFTFSSSGIFLNSGPGRSQHACRADWYGMRTFRLVGERLPADDALLLVFDDLDALGVQRPLQLAELDVCADASSKPNRGKHFRLVYTPFHVARAPEKLYSVDAMVVYAVV